MYKIINVWISFYFNKLQLWNDSKLMWNKTMYDNINFIELDPTEVWRPQINLQNRYDENTRK